MSTIQKYYKEKNIFLNEIGLKMAEISELRGIL